jgi:hypothetical protein
MTRIKSFFSSGNCNGASWLIKLSNVFIEDFDIKEELLHILQLDQLATSTVPNMDLQEITDDNGNSCLSFIFYFNF